MADFVSDGGDEVNVGIVVEVVQPTSRPPSRSVRTAPHRRLVLAGAAAVVCLAYFAAALTNGKTLRPDPRPEGFHVLIAEALLHGRLDVLPPPPGLLALPDPYDPGANAEFRAHGYHDLALYRGRLYTATGPTTAVLVHLPARLIGVRLNANAATLLCALGAFFSALGILLECKRLFRWRVPLWSEALTLVAVGLGSPTLWLVSIGRSYESAIACGSFLVGAGTYCLLRGLRDPSQPSRTLLAIGGFTLAAAIGARPHFAAAAMFAAAAVFAILRSRAGTRQRALGAVVAVAAPYVAVVALLGLYNVGRFGSVTEFGTRYQLAAMNMRTYEFYRADYVLPNITDYLTLPPRLDASWPFVHLQPNTFVNDPDRHGHEPLAGALWLWPFLLAGLLSAAVGGRTFWRRHRPVAVAIVLTTTFALTIVLALSLPFNSSTMRYTVDFTPALALAGVMGWAEAYTASSRRGVRRPLLAAVWAASTTASVLVGIALAITPCRGTGSC